MGREWGRGRARVIHTSERQLFCKRSSYLCYNSLFEEKSRGATSSSLSFTPCAAGCTIFCFFSWVLPADPGRAGFRVRDKGREFRRHVFDIFPGTAVAKRDGTTYCRSDSVYEFGKIEKATTTPPFFPTSFGGIAAGFRAPALVFFVVVAPSCFSRKSWRPN